MYTIIAQHTTEQVFENIPSAHVAWLVGQLLAEYRYREGCDIRVVRQPEPTEPTAE